MTIVVVDGLNTLLFNDVHVFEPYVMNSISHPLLLLLLLLCLWCLYSWGTNTQVEE